MAHEKDTTRGDSGNGQRVGRQHVWAHANHRIGQAVGNRMSSRNASQEACRFLQPVSIT